MNLRIEKSPSRGRFPSRVVFHEDPDVVHELEELARRQGHSLAAEIRAAVRSWLRRQEQPA